MITDKEINQVADDEKQKDWNELRYADIYKDAFVDGAKWARSKVSRVELPVKPEIAEEKLAEEMAEEVADVMMNFDENINYDNILNSWKAYFINKLKEKG